LVSIIPSDPVDVPRSAPRNNERTRLVVKRTHLQEPVTAANGSNGDRDRDEPAIVHKIPSVLEPKGQESQLWDD
jgi:hypothetical protein